LQHSSGPHAAVESPERKPRRAWPADALAGPRMAPGHGSVLAGKVAAFARQHVVNFAQTTWRTIRHHEHRLAERHGYSDMPLATRGLAAALLTVLTVGFVSAFTLRGNEYRAVAEPVVSLDPLATLEVPLPAAPRTVVAGKTLSAIPEAQPTADAPAADHAIAGRRTPTLLPTGKGMWFHTLEQTGLSVEQIVEQAKATGLSHLYVRVGSSKRGFHGGLDLDRLLPAAHAAGLEVVGWDFPYLHDPNADVQRALEAIAYATPDGHRIDAFSADIETGSEGVQLAADRVDYYAANVRYYVGPGYPLIGTVPNACLNETFPYAEVARHFDAIAPMVYWITRDPAADVACNIDRLAPLGVAVMPIGQAYDPAIDNPSLVGLMPGYDHLAAFMRTAAEKGATAVSFWAWHTASPEMWQAITDAPWYSLVPMAPGHDAPDQVAVLQRLLNVYRYAVPVDGRYGADTIGALAQLQTDLGLAPTGTLDAATLDAVRSTSRG